LTLFSELQFSRGNTVYQEKRNSI